MQHKVTARELLNNKLGIRHWGQYKDFENVKSKLSIPEMQIICKWLNVTMILSKRYTHVIPDGMKRLYLDLLKHISVNDEPR